MTIIFNAFFTLRLPWSLHYWEMILTLIWVSSLYSNLNVVQCHLETVNYHWWYTFSFIVFICICYQIQIQNSYMLPYIVCSTKWYYYPLFTISPLASEVNIIQTSWMDGLRLAWVHQCHCFRIWIHANCGMIYSSWNVYLALLSGVGWSVGRFQDFQASVGSLSSLSRLATPPQSPQIEDIQEWRSSLQAGGEPGLFVYFCKKNG